ncbi:alpha/beta fold hydrolase [Rufibacter sp. LB8]|uniref:alpha/beta fold hydrolase n=1 Tax=Rufibacter sp. LB8 TaxID=2777781 RepID=UPI00178C1DAE|nr:alpha/beta hydrolase [Rufibacter sp. LB8]
MKNPILRRLSVALSLCIAFFIAISFPAEAQKNQAAAANPSAADQSTFLNEQRFITINGQDQWVTIKGNPAKPVLLFLHGGPGSPLTPYADQLYGSWEKDFLLVQWDQRGAGKTFGKNAPKELTPDFLSANPLTLAQMTADGVALSEYLIKHLGKKKITLLGTSWGSILGVEMALKRPDLYSAYVGHSQVVNLWANFELAYKKVLALAQQAKDQPAIDLLQTIGAPPYADPKNYGQMLRVVKRYERSRAQPAPAAWNKIAPEYDNEQDTQHRYDGDDYSFVNLIGDKKLNLPSMIADQDFMRTGLKFKLPVYFIQGAGDLTTAPELTTAYFNKLKAPKKELVLLPNSAHGHNQLVIDAQLKILQEKVVPKAK